MEENVVNPTASATPQEASAPVNGDTSNNPSPEQVKDQTKKLTGDQLLGKILACKDETKDVLKKVPYKVNNGEQFTNILRQISNDQEICLKYIEVLSSNIKNISEKDIGSLPEALSSTRNRLVSEQKIVHILGSKNPFVEKEVLPQELKTKKMEAIYSLQAYASMSRTQEEVEWSKYKAFAEVRQESGAEQKIPEKTSDFNPLGLIVIGFILFVVFKRSEWAQKLFSGAVSTVLKKEEAPKLTKEDKKDQDPGQV